MEQLQQMVMKLFQVFQTTQLIISVVRRKISTALATAVRFHFTQAQAGRTADCHNEPRDEYRTDKRATKRPGREFEQHRDRRMV